MAMLKNQRVNNHKSTSGWWLTYPPEKYESQIGSTSQLLGNIKNVPTTNQTSSGPRRWNKLTDVRPFNCRPCTFVCRGYLWDEITLHEGPIDTLNQTYALCVFSAKCIRYNTFSMIFRSDVYFVCIVPSIKQKKNTLGLINIDVSKTHGISVRKWFTFMVGFPHLGLVYRRITFKPIFSARNLLVYGNSNIKKMSRDTWVHCATTSRPPRPAFRSRAAPHVTSLRGCERRASCWRII